MSRTREEPYPSTLFQQLAVLIGMMGALIIPLLGLTKLAQKTRDYEHHENGILTAPADPDPAAQEPYIPKPLPPLPELVTFDPLPPLPEEIVPPRVPEELPPLLVINDPRASAKQQLEVAKAELTEKRSQTAAPTPEDRSRLELLTDHLARLKDELRKVMSDRQRLDEETRQAEKELDQLRKLQIDRERQSNHVENRYAIVPYSGPNGTARRPIYLECRGTGITLQPEGVTLDVELFRNASPGNNPLAVLVRALVNELKTEGPDGTPYPLLIVRPEGIIGYYVAQQALSQIGVPVGYELVDDNIELSFDEPDPRQRAVAETVIAAIRQQQLVPVEMTPAFGGYPSRANNPYASGRPGASRPGVGSLLARRGGNGPPGYSGIMGAMPGSGGPSASNGARGSSGTEFGGSGESEDDNPAAGAAANPSGASTSGPQTSSRLGSGATVGQGRTGGAGVGDAGSGQPATGNADGEVDEGEEYTLSRGPALGRPLSGSMPGSGAFSSGAGTGTRGRSPLPRPVDIELDQSGAGPVQDQNAGPGGASPSSLPPEEEAEGLLQPDTNAFASVSERRPGGSRPSSRRPKKLTFDELVHSQKPQDSDAEPVSMDDPPNLGPPEQGASGASVPGIRVAQRSMRRNVTVECRSDGLVLLPERRFVPLANDADLPAAIEETYRHILQQVSRWEPAGNYYRWQPVLHLRVQPDAIANYYSLRLALLGSRIEVEREMVEDESIWGLTRRSLREVWKQPKSY